MPTKRQRRKRRRRIESAAAGEGMPRPEASEPSPVVRDDVQRAAAASRKGAPGKAPEALWGSFPLSELVVLIGLILLVVGFFVAGHQGAVMIVVGLALGALAGVELAAREHFSGFRSHTVLLAAAVAMTVFVVLALAAGLSPPISAAAAALIFGGSVWLFASAFRRRSGGALFRIRGS